MQFLRYESGQRDKETYRSVLIGDKVVTKKLIYLTSADET